MLEYNLQFLGIPEHLLGGNVFNFLDLENCRADLNLKLFKQKFENYLNPKPKIKPRRHALPLNLIGLI